MSTDLPPLVDVHSHADRGPNWEHKGTPETETESALNSGFGTVLVMPNRKPEILSYKELLWARRRAVEQAHCDIGFHFGSIGDNLQEFPRVWLSVYGLKLYLGETTGGLQISLDTAAKIFPAWRADKPILIHVEEASVLDKVISLATQYRRRLHVCHVNLAEEVELIRQAKVDGVAITAEVCPHHCIFTEEDLGVLGPYGIMKPLLATHRDVEALWRGIRDGTIDIVATDHAPHSPEEKASDTPPFGVTCEPAFSVMWYHFSQRGLTIEHLVNMMHLKPVEIFKVRKDEASHLEVDLDTEFIVEPWMIHSKAGHSPYVGRKAQGRIRSITLHGTEVMRDGKILAKKGKVI